MSLLIALRATLSLAHTPCFLHLCLCWFNGIDHLSHRFACIAVSIWDLLRNPIPAGGRPCHEDQHICHLNHQLAALDFLLRNQP